MDKRLRSPNYPAIGLPEAVERIGVLYRTLHNHGAPREMIARALGYAGLNGASATTISALNKYGLLDRDGEELKVSDRARRILTPLSEEERALAIREAAFLPPLFAELAEKFPGRVPNDELLRNYLSRKGFAPGALSSVVLAYRATSEMVGGGATPYGGLENQPDEAPPMPTPTATIAAPLRQAVPSAHHVEIIGKERSLGRYDFEGGQYVRIAASDGVDTETALEMLDVLIDLKRKELARQARLANRVIATPNPEAENNPDEE